jgi:hypothetical protein
VALRLTGGDDRSIGLACGQAELLRYVYRPAGPQAESPRPFFHPLRTRGGALVSGYRPADHPWHQGLSWALPNVGTENFWGGPTYQRGNGYRQLANNGTVRHDRFAAAGVLDGELGLDEQLTWLTGQGQAWFAERRRIRARLLAGYAAWALLFETTMLNVHRAALTIGSPGTEGRAGAGYGGLFWRGPAEFRGGAVIAPGGPDAGQMGWRGPWLGFAGGEAQPGPAATLVFREDPGNAGYPGAWFVRREPYACLCPAPFFDAERTVPPGAALTLRYQVAVADGGLSVAACSDLVDQLAAWGERQPARRSPVSGQ